MPGEIRHHFVRFGKVWVKAEEVEAVLEQSDGSTEIRTRSGFTYPSSLDAAGTLTMLHRGMTEGVAPSAG